MGNSIGIIGGADGPTSVLVAERIESALELIVGSFLAGLGAGIVIAVITGIVVYVVTKNKYKNK